MVEFQIDGLFIFSVLLAVLITAAATAWYTGALDRLYVQMSEKYFRAKAKTEMLSLQARGKKEGVDFSKGQLDGSKQAKAMQDRLGSLPGKEAVGKGVNGLSDIAPGLGM
jgi:hypothetical protein